MWIWKFSLRISCAIQYDRKQIGSWCTRGSTVFWSRNKVRKDQLSARGLLSWNLNILKEKTWRLLRRQSISKLQRQQQRCRFRFSLVRCENIMGSLSHQYCKWNQWLVLHSYRAIILPLGSWILRLQKPDATHDDFKLKMFSQCSWYTSPLLPLLLQVVCPHSLSCCFFLWNHLHPHCSKPKCHCLHLGSLLSSHLLRFLLVRFLLGSHRSSNCIHVLLVDDAHKQGRTISLQVGHDNTQKHWGAMGQYE